MSKKLLVLVVLLLTVTAAGQFERPIARQFDELGRAPDGEVKVRLHHLYVDLGNDPTAHAVFVNYGSARQIAAREKQIMKAIAFQRLDPRRLTILRAGPWPQVLTEMWFVPAGAENPVPKKAASLFAQFGKLSDRQLKVRFEKLFAELERKPEAKAVVLVSGTEKRLTVEKIRILNTMPEGRFDQKRMEVVTVESYLPLTTMIWLTAERK